MRTAAYWVILLWVATTLALQTPTANSEEDQNATSEAMTDGLGTLVSVTRAFSDTMMTPGERQASENTTQASQAVASEAVTFKPSQTVSRKPSRKPSAGHRTSSKPSKKPAGNQATSLATSSKPSKKATANQAVSSKVTQEPSAAIITTTPLPSTILAALATSNTSADPVPPSTLASVSPEPTTPGTPVRRYPCTCKDGACLCCTGYILNRFNFTTNNKACLKVEYEPDEFEFNVKLLFNQRLLYQRKINGKNPQPICLPIRRLIAVNACIKFSNVYMIGRNLHACLDFKGDWNDEIELFSVSFECFRLGADGVAIVKPEEGGGLPVPTHKPSNLGPEDYDDSARKAKRTFYIDYDDFFAYA